MLLLSSSSLLVSKHYCQGELKSMALAFKANSCHQDQQIKNCPLHGQNSSSSDEEKKGCCDTQTDLLKTDYSPAITLADQVQDQHSWTTASLVVERLPSIELRDETYPFFTYQPPLLVYNLPVSLQTFLC